MSLNSIRTVLGVDLKLFMLTSVAYCFKASRGTRLEFAIKNFLICSM